jgi:putative ABC transport system permease protein
MLTDLRLALRTMRACAGSSVAMVLSLSLGLALNVALFAFVDAAILHPLPFPNAERLVAIWGTPDFAVRRGLDGPRLEQWAAQSAMVEAAATFQLTPFDVTLADAEDPIHGFLVGRSMMSVLGVAPVLGRTFSAAPVDEGSEVLIAHDLWQARFGGSPDVIGKTVAIDGEQHDIVGVMPSGFYFPNTGSRLWAVLKQDSQVQMVARVSADARLDQLRTELNAVFGDSREDRERTSPGGSAGVFWLRRLVVDDYEAASLALWGASWLLLLAACANVSSVLAARALARARSLAIRQALGARAWDLYRLAFVETTLLAIGAGVVGSFLASMAFQTLRLFDLSALPGAAATRLSHRALTYVATVACVLGIIAAVVPAALSRRQGLLAMLRSGEAGSATRRVARIRQLLVWLEVTAAMTLVVAAGFLIQSFGRLARVDWGFEPENLIVATVTLPRHMAGQIEAQAGFTDRVLSRLDGVPGVQFHAAGHAMPLGLNQWAPAAILAEGRIWAIGVRTVSDGYFRTLGIPIRSAQLPGRGEAQFTDRVAVVDRFLAQMTWPGQDPLGKHFTLLRPTPSFLQAYRRDRRVMLDRQRAFAHESWEPDGSPWLIVGQAPEVRMFGLTERTGAVAYLNYRQFQRPFPQQAFMVRVASSQNAAAIARFLRVAIREAEPAARVDVSEGEQLVAQATGRSGSRTLLTVLSALLGSLALCIGAVGVFGVASLTATTQLKELAIRRSLGATGRQILGAVYGTQLRIVVLGVISGAAGGFLLNQPLRSFLFGVSTSDPATYVLAALVTLAMAAMAAGPALRRVLRVSPVDVLRYE